MAENRNLTALRGRVAQILSSRELVINIGSLAGVKEGMRFDVINPKGEDIVDPGTGLVLGSLSRAKVRVRIVEVHEKLAVAQTFRSKRENVGGVAPQNYFTRFLTPEQWTVKYETFRAKERNWSDLEEGQSFVKVGDPVVEIQAPEPEQ